jgi:hypothetical protein
MPLVWDEDKQAWAGGPAIVNQANAAADPPTQAEFNALAAKFNALLAACRDAGIIAID